MDPHTPLPVFLRRNSRRIAHIPQPRAQPDPFPHEHPVAGRVETTGEEYVVNELIKLADISLQLQFAFGSRFNEFKTEPYASKRGSQLMRRMGEQNFVSIDQAFDAGGSLIEALGQAGNLVATLNLDACLQIARSKRFDAAL